VGQETTISSGHVCIVLESSVSIGLSAVQVSSYLEGVLIIDLAGSVVWIRLGGNFCVVFAGRHIAHF